tara:strand:- start:981 stop:1163 length:183 start_codon:yes stop_codon:yes gene_type:complete
MTNQELCEKLLKIEKFHRWFADLTTEQRNENAPKISEISDIITGWCEEMVDALNEREDND